MHVGDQWRLAGLEQGTVEVVTGIHEAGPELGEVKVETGVQEGCLFETRQTQGMASSSSLCGVRAGSEQDAERRGP